METVLRRLSGESSISGVPQHGKIDMRKMRPRCAWPHWLCRAGQSFFRFCTADRCGMTAPIDCPSGYTEIDLTEKCHRWLPHQYTGHEVQNGRVRHARKNRHRLYRLCANLGDSHLLLDRLAVVIGEYMAAGSHASSLPMSVTFSIQGAEILGNQKLTPSIRKFRESIDTYYRIL